MKAVQFEKFGSAAETLKQVNLSIPEIKPDEVLVRLYTSGINPSDTKKRSGAFPNLLDSGPIIPHSDGAGIIENVGEEVDRTRIGERVFVYQAQHNRRMGTAAQYVVVSDSRAPKLPESISFEVGACIGIPIMTAHRCVFATGDVKNQKLLITGGAGRVASYAIQWAKHAGAQVFTTASNPLDTDFCLDMGADHVVNHRNTSWGRELDSLCENEKIDHVIDCEFGANLIEILQCIRTSGLISTYGSTLDASPKLPFRDMMFKDLTIRMIIVYDMPESAKNQAIRDTQELLFEDTFRHRIRTFPLEEVSRAHALVEEGGGGCVVLNVD